MTTPPCAGSTRRAPTSLRRLPNSPDDPYSLASRPPSLSRIPRARFVTGLSESVSISSSSITSRTRPPGDVGRLPPAVPAFSSPRAARRSGPFVLSRLRPSRARTPSNSSRANSLTPARNSWRPTSSATTLAISPLRSPSFADYSTNPVPTTGVRCVCSLRCEKPALLSGPRPTPTRTPYPSTTSPTFSACLTPASRCSMTLHPTTRSPARCYGPVAGSRPSLSRLSCSVTRPLDCADGRCQKRMRR